MKRGNISYYTMSKYSSERRTKSLRNIQLHTGKHLEDIFYAIENSADVDTLTSTLRSMTDWEIWVDYADRRSVRYVLFDMCGEKSFLRITFDEEAPVDED